ncbi:TetR/AcrR family transcriptional regulator [Streptomyces sp. NPDC056390]|uniref:TetR/AcrR family transcriptional regulator n=1 Tax=Streptomyces sp. NPDC056390 TaxID=3345806 RepID=UPI0035E16D74
MQVILQAAEQVLRRDPAASMEQIAAAAGVARTTVHRRFVNRDALIEALRQWVTSEFARAFDAARPQTAPPLIALYQVTANLLQVKVDWGFALSRMQASTSTSGDDSEVHQRCRALFRRALDESVLRPGIDTDWAARVFLSLLHASVYEGQQGGDTDALATRIVDTLLQGLGSKGISG